jgi:hypothetical protein
MRDIRVPTAKELQNRANTLLSDLRMNDDILSGDYSDLFTQIDSTKTGVDSIMDAFNGQVNHYSQWDTEEEYQRAKAYYDKWGHYADADDFAYYSTKGAMIKNPTTDAAERNGRFLWWEWGGDDIGNIVTYSRENADMLAMAYTNGESTKGNYKYRSMTDEEVDIYNYLLAKEGKEKANEFLSFLDEDLNAREGGELAGRITGIDIPVVENLAIGLYGIGAGIDQWVSGTRQLFTNEKLPTTVEQYANAPYVLSEYTRHYVLVDKDEKRTEKDYFFHYISQRGYSQRYDLLEEVMTFDRGKILQAECALVDAPTMWKAGAEAIKKDGYFFVRKSQV